MWRQQACYRHLFCFKRKEGKIGWWQQACCCHFVRNKNKRKKRWWHTCVITFFTSNRNKKMKNEVGGVFFFSSKRKEKKVLRKKTHKEGEKMQRREGAYLSFPASTFGMKHSSCCLPSTFLQYWALHLLQALCLVCSWNYVLLKVETFPELLRWSEQEMRWERYEGPR